MGDYWAGVLTNAVAVLITSTSSPVFTLLIGPVSFLWQKLPPWMKGRNTALEGADGCHEIVHDAMLDLLEYIPRLPRGGPRRIRLDDVNLVAPRRRRQGAELVGAGSLIVIFLGLPLACHSSCFDLVCRDCYGYRRSLEFSTSQCLPI